MSMLISFFGKWAVCSRGGAQLMKDPFRIVSGFIRCKGLLLGIFEISPLKMKVFVVYEF